jgi:hypothetical protein
MPGWLGEPLDVGYAIDVLHPLASCCRAGQACCAKPGQLQPCGVRGSRTTAAPT